MSEARLWTSGADKQHRQEVRPHGEHSVLLGWILPVEIERRNLSGTDPFWGFRGACRLGHHLADQVKNTPAPPKGINEMYAALEIAWHGEVGDPSPDAPAAGLEFRTLVHDKLDGQAVIYQDAICYDINLGAVMSRYENAGWGAWYLWAPDGVPLAARLVAAAGRAEEAGTVMERIRTAWDAELKPDG